MTEIEQLKSELNQKTSELNESLNDQYLLHERLIFCTKTLKEIECLLETVKTNLINSNENAHKLALENQHLKLTCDEWMKRAIELEFKVLTALDTTKK